MEQMLKMQAEQDAAAAASSSADAKEEEAGFISAKKWEGSKKGRVFQMGPKGLGYYPDPALKDEQAEKTAPSKKRPSVFAPGASSSLKKKKTQSQPAAAETAKDERKASLADAYLKMMAQNDAENCRGDHKQGA